MNDPQTTPTADHCDYCGHRAADLHPVDHDEGYQWQDMICTRCAALNGIPLTEPDHCGACGREAAPGCDVVYVGDRPLCGPCLRREKAACGADGPEWARLLQEQAA